MKTKVRILATAAAVALAAAVFPAAAGEGLAIGDSMPMGGSRLMGLDGNHVSMGELTGRKGTLVVFSCNSCPWAKAWESRIADLGNSYQARGIGVVQINSNDPARDSEDGLDAMKVRAQKLALQFPYLVDETSGLARVYGATRTPEAFLFDASGKLVYHGTIDDNAHEPGKVKAHYLQDALEAVTAGRAVAVAETKALGCGIKFRKKS
ncbi:MAG: thioredoxin family protein [Acidobacteriota bacterium]